MKKAIICGYYGQGNAGDEALLLSLLERLPNDIEPIVLSANPILTKKNYGVKSYSRLDICRQIILLGKKDYFIWGGGSLMQDVTSIKSPLFYAGLMKLAQQKGLITLAYAQGIGPLNSPFTKWITEQVLKNCQGISVRDKGSAKLLDQWGLNYFIASDPVWALSSKKNDKLNLLSSPLIGFNIRNHSTITERKIELFTQALQKLQKETKANILLIPFQESNDLFLCEKIGETLKHNYQIINIKNPQELKGIFQEITMLIGMRLHSLIMGASEGCKCFALSYDPKVSQLMEELNIQGYELDKMPNDAHKIANDWLNVYHNSHNLCEQKREELKQSALKHQQLFFV